MAVSDVVARPVRGAAQGGTALVLVEAVDSFLYDMTDRQYGAAVALLSIVLSWLQVIVENKAGKALMREPEPPKKALEVVEEAGDGA